jgi:RHS repeat-associated protein
VLSDGSNTYLYGLDRISQQNVVGLQYYLGDALGSMRQLTNAVGSVTLARGYEPFGKLLSSAGNPLTKYGYTGEWTDPTNLVYLRARYYDPAMGRFLSEDPVRGFATLPQTFNPYTYAINNPVRHTDPSGEIIPLLVAGGVIGGFVGGTLYAITHTNDFSWGGLGGSMVGGAIAGSIGVIAAPIAGSFASVLGLSSTGLLATAGLIPLVNASAGGLSYLTGGVVENFLNSTFFGWCTPTWQFSWSGLALSAGLSGLGGYIGYKAWPVNGMNTIRQAQYFAPRTWLGVLPKTGMGISAKNILYRATPVSVTIGFSNWLLNP